MNKRMRKKILRQGMGHPKFQEAFFEEYRLSCEELANRVSKAINKIPIILEKFAEEISRLSAVLYEGRII